MIDKVTLTFTRKQAQSILAALRNVDARAEWLDSDMPRGYQWEQVAMMRLRHALINAVEVE